jgi:transposase-like protein
MVTYALSCPACQSVDVIRHGRTSQHQRYRCKECGLTFSDGPKRPDDFKEMVLAAYQERSSMRGIARTFKISRNTLTKWLEEKGGSCPR